MSLKFRPDIEGLRALAIVPVVLFHAFPSLLPGGFVGVDVFFVISGFLITQLLLQRLAAGQYSIRSFYGARIRRIFPALFAMLAVVAPLSVCLLSPDWLQEFGRTLGATALFFSNQELYRTSGYFDTATELKPLVHTWSLAVEEQYYIVFPLLLALLHRRWKRGMVPVLAAVCVVSLALSMHWVRSDPPLAFYSALSRAFELMLGSLLAAQVRGAAAPRAVREVAAMLGLAAVAAACVVLNAKSPFPGLAALLPSVGAGLLIWSGGQGSSLARRLVSLPPLRWLGAMSFSLYLWHWPALVFTRHGLLGEPTAWQAGAAVIASVALAWASLRWVETPWRRASHSDPRLLTMGATCIAATMAVAWVLVKRTDWVQPLDASTRLLYQGALDVNPKGRSCHGDWNRPIAYQNRCRYGDAGSRGHTAVWGDSHGVELALAMGELAGRHDHAVAQITSAACPPAVDFAPRTRPNCIEHNAATLRALVADVTVERVVLIARYEAYLEEDATAFSQGFERSVRALLAAGKAVVLLEPFPVYAYPVPAALGALARRGDSPARFEQTWAHYQSSQARTLAMLGSLAGLPGVTLFETGRTMCGGGRCLVSADGVSLYLDHNHLSLAGARWLLAGRGSELVVRQSAAPRHVPANDVRTP